MNIYQIKHGEAITLVFCAICPTEERAKALLHT